MDPPLVDSHEEGQWTSLLRAKVCPCQAETQSIHQSMATGCFVQLILLNRGDPHIGLNNHWNSAVSPKRPSLGSRNPLNHLEPMRPDLVPHRTSDHLTTATPVGGADPSLDLRASANVSILENLDAREIGYNAIARGARNTGRRQTGREVTGDLN